MISILLSALLAGQATAGQAPPTSVVCVQMSSSDAAPLPDATVVLLLSNGDAERAVSRSSDASGLACVEVLQGRYRLLAQKDGFTIDERDVNADTPRIEVAVTLYPAALATSVEVRGRRGIDAPIGSGGTVSGSLIDIVPLRGDSALSLLPLLPGILRAPDGQLRMKGGQASQMRYQVGASSLNDPSTGELGFDLPTDAVDQVESLPHPYLPEYGRFSAGLADIQTRSGGDQWFVRPWGYIPKPRFRDHKFWQWRGLRYFRPRLAFGGPLGTPRVQLAQSLHYRYVTNEVKSLPDDPAVKLQSLNTFTRLDVTLSARHHLEGNVSFFPRTVEGVTLSTFNPPEVTARFKQTGYYTSVVQRSEWRPSLVTETTFSARRFNVNVNPRAAGPMILTPEKVRGAYFNQQERHTDTWQIAHALTRGVNAPWGDHVLKLGAELLASRYRGASFSREVEVRRRDGTLAERITSSGPSTERVDSVDASVFAQDQWRAGDHLMIEGGVRVDRDGVIKRWNLSPRAGLAVALGSDGRSFIRGGVGRFYQPTPLLIGAFGDFETRTSAVYGVAEEAPIGVSAWTPHAGTLVTPSAVTWNIELDHRLSDRLQLRLNHLRRQGRDEFVVGPDASTGTLRLASSGRSRYWEQEVTVRYATSATREFIASYVRSEAHANLNAFEQYFGNIRVPTIRADEFGPVAWDAPHRMILRGRVGGPKKLEFLPLFEVRTGFPYSVVNAEQQFVGPRNSARFPVFHSLDLAVQRPMKIFKRETTVGVRIFNLFGTFNPRDVQANIDSPQFGRVYNPIERYVSMTFAFN